MCGPFELLERVGEVAYRLALPPALEGIHPVFHVSQLRLLVPDQIMGSYEEYRLSRIILQRIASSDFFGSEDESLKKEEFSWYLCRGRTEVRREPLGRWQIG